MGALSAPGGITPTALLAANSSSWQTLTIGGAQIL